ncbi:glycosyltransferase [Helicobacter apodemus]|uniref:Glycosyltransferase n=1 Tax=Helicobacter apodemus TaxID=135569 RepID=A0A4V6I6P8_9HELI|nr:glycosyltransferase [Helicobacter apodemus]TLE16378.1 glycosyltransferase [Helicobacter apodemus]
MKITFLIDVMRRGGAQKILSLILDILSCNGFEVQLVVLKKTQDVMEIPNIKVFYLLGSEKEPLLSNSFLLLESFSNIAKDCDLIVSFMDFITSYYAVLGAKILSKPYCIFVRCEPSFVENNFSQSSINHTLYAMCLQGALRVVCNSRASCKDVEVNFGVLRTKIDLLYNPIDTAKIMRLSQQALEFPKQEGEVFCFAIGRLHTQKNYLTLLQAFKALPNFIKLYILGEGEQREEIEAYLQTHQMQNVILLGFKENIYPLLKKADIFIHTSYYEGFPNAVLEAASLGLPLLLSNIPTHKEIFEDKALFFDPYNAEELCENLKGLIKNTALLAKLKKQSFEALKQYSMESFSKEVLRIFQEVKIALGKPS